MVQCTQAPTLTYSSFSCFLLSEWWLHSVNDTGVQNTPQSARIFENLEDIGSYVLVRMAVCPISVK